ncbi:hypothetical protein [Thalassospira xiamenensis]|jgi:hypothetical protein|uniref:hypothetical protein n=1 Tax=Thalassospira xiamenensis TaxID=220697 RepID=UPI003AA9949A
MDGVVLGNLVRQYEPERLFSGSGHSSDLVIDNDLHRQTKIDALHWLRGVCHQAGSTGWLCALKIKYWDWDHYCRHPDKE